MVKFLKLFLLILIFVSGCTKTGSTHTTESPFFTGEMEEIKPKMGDEVQCTMETEETDCGRDACSKGWVVWNRCVDNYCYKYKFQCSKYCKIVEGDPDCV